RISPRERAFSQCSVVQGAGRLNTPNSFMNVLISRHPNGTMVINATRIATSQNIGQRQRPRSNLRLLNLPEIEAWAWPALYHCWSNTNGTSVARNVIDSELATPWSGGSWVIAR